MTNIQKMAAIGGGVIGGGWIARFVLNGIDVMVHDPHPEAERIVGEVLANAERAYRKMLSAPITRMGTVTFTDSIEDAVRYADYIQESVPERLEIKHRVLAEIERHARADAIIGSSTSNLTPTELQEPLKRPGQMLIMHPFNPVYLLPLVEVVPSAANSEAVVQEAMEIADMIGMKPLRVRKELKAHIGNRFLEAVWREALWMIKDDVATTEELDDVIRYGLGLRFAQMGQYESYRIAGGEGGMQHFIGQFGPTLDWPLTKLMDTPELDAALVDKIASQSDAQSGAHSIRELERIRDDNLVAIMQALRVNNWGAGQTLAEMDERFRARADAGASESDPSQPLALYAVTVPAAWTDYNGHMTEHRYSEAFGHATDAFLTLAGMDSAYMDAGCSVFTAESQVRFRREVKAGAAVTVRTQLLGLGEKRLHLLHQMVTSDGAVAATAELSLAHVDTKEGGSCPFRAPMAEKLAALWDGQKALPKPDFINRAIRAV